MASHRPASRIVLTWVVIIALLAIAAFVAAFWPQINPVATPTPTTAPTATLIPTATATQVPTATETPIPTATPTATATATATATSTEAPTSTPEATATPSEPEAVIQADVLNIRSGPSTAYPSIDRASTGQLYRIVGKNDDNSWWQITDGEITGWVAAAYTDASGPLESLEVVDVPPPPTAEPQAMAAASSATAGFFGYGIQIDPYGDRGASIGAIKNAGISWVKFQVPWKDFEGTQGQKNFPDDVVNDLANNGLQILASIVKAPNWARSADQGYAYEGPPQNPGDYASYVGAFAGHYCGRVQAIEVWNEQNLYYEWGNETLDAARYVRLLAAAYNAIKGACPSMIVVSGAPTPTGAQPPAAIRDTLYLEQMYQAGLRNYCDAVGVHPSGYGNPPDATVQAFQAGTFSRPSHVNDSSFYFRNTMEQYRNIMIKYGDGNKRLWPTEFGWASSGSPVAGYEYAAYNSEQQQGEYIVRAYEMMRNWGFVGVAFLWNLNYNVTAPGSELAAFGIMGRPAYGRLQSMPK